MSTQNITIYEPNFTQIPNSVISVMPQLTETEFKVIMAICRKTFGFHKGRDRISLTQLEEMTGMARSSIATALKSEKFKTLIRVHKTPKGNEYEPIITPNKANEGSSKSELPDEELVQNLNYPSSKSELGASSKSEHTKENSTKETIQKKGRAPDDVAPPDDQDSEDQPDSRTSPGSEKRMYGVPVPEPLQNVDGFVGAYRKWRDYLKEVHKRQPAIYQVEEQFRQLVEFAEDGHSPVQVIRDCIARESKSLYVRQDFGASEDKEEKKFLGRPDAVHIN